QVAGVEDLEFGPHAQGLDPLRPLPEHVRGGDVDVRPFAEVEGPAVDRADLGQQLFDVGETVEGVMRSVPGIVVRGSCGSTTRSPPMPAVRLMTGSTSAARIRRTTSR